LLDCPFKMSDFLEINIANPRIIVRFTTFEPRQRLFCCLGTDGNNEGFVEKTLLHQEGTSIEMCQNKINRTYLLF